MFTLSEDRTQVIIDESRKNSIITFLRANDATIRPPLKYLWEKLHLADGWSDSSRIGALLYLELLGSHIPRCSTKPVLPIHNASGNTYGLRAIFYRIGTIFEERPYPLYIPKEWTQFIELLGLQASGNCLTDLEHIIDLFWSYKIQIDAVKHSRIHDPLRGVLDEIEPDSSTDTGGDQDSNNNNVRSTTSNVKRKHSERRDCKKKSNDNYNFPRLHIKDSDII